nr:sulfotransferase [Phaeobacter sp. J2-8]
MFKRAIWAQSVPDPTDIAISVDLFQRAMTRGLAGNLSGQELALLDQLAADLPPGGPWNCGARSPDVTRLMAAGEQPGGQGQPWGWKEPNTHLFLPQLNQNIDGLRYIHVMRNGFDMAFSGNTWQADHWAHHYGLSPTSGDSVPLHQLRYWVAANRRALEYGRSHMHGRFIVVDYDDFCAHPDVHWPRLQRFLGRPADTAIPDGLIAPSSIGRSKPQDLSIFPSDLRDAVRALQTEARHYPANSGV